MPGFPDQPAGFAAPPGIAPPGVAAVPPAGPGTHSDFGPPPAPAGEAALPAATGDRPTGEGLPPAPGPAGETGGERSGPRLGVIVGMVLAGATLLVLITIGAVFALSMISDSPPSYAVGDCVVQSGASAELADCGAPDAYRIVSEVDSRAQCPDPAQPAVEVTGPPVQVFCLEPANAGAEDPAGESPAPTGPPGSPPAAEQ